MDIAVMFILEDAPENEAEAQPDALQDLLAAGKQGGVRHQKGPLVFDGKVEYNNKHIMLLEDIIRHIDAVTTDDPVVCTTWKASREPYEIRKNSVAGRERAF